MGRRSMHSVLLAAALTAISMASAYATDAVTPSPQTATNPKVAKQVLTEAQKEALVAARSAFSAAKANARDGFDRALADAQAIRDQAIAAAGKDQNAARAARKDYRDSYETILNAYRLDMKNARVNFLSALVAAKIRIKGY